MSDRSLDDTPDDGPDEVIAEVRAARESIAAEHGYDIGRIFAALKRREQESDRPKVAPSPKRPAPATSA